MSILDSISVFGLNKLGLELALQCALTVEEWFPGCCNFALECGIDSVHSYQKTETPEVKKCCNCPRMALPGKSKCKRCFDTQRRANNMYYQRKMAAKRSERL